MIGLMYLQIADALTHVPDVLTYMSRLTNQTVFNFCSIPQVMAIATLDACFNNHAVFSSVVKIRKGEAVSLMMEATNMSSLYAVFDRYIDSIRTKSVVLPHTQAVLVNEALLKSVRKLDAARFSGLLRQPASSSLPATLAVFAAGTVAGYALRQRFPDVHTSAYAVVAHACESVASLVARKS
jgi:hypothetical protein